MERIRWQLGNSDDIGVATVEPLDRATHYHKIEDWNGGVEYDLRVIAVNEAGEGEPSEEISALVHPIAPRLVSLEVTNGDLTPTYDRLLDESSAPEAAAFQVNRSWTTDLNTNRLIEVTNVAITGEQVMLTLNPTNRLIEVTNVAITGEQVMLTLNPKLRTNNQSYSWSYRVPTGTNAAPLRDPHGNEVLPVGNQ